jgi:hypothetical protein
MEILRESSSRDLFSWHGDSFILEDFSRQHDVLPRVPACGK